MAKLFHNDVLDAPADVIDQANIMTLCSAQPTTRAEAVTTFALADVAMTVNTDYTKADGDVSGRKVTVAPKPSVSVDVSGTGDHVALCDGTRLLAVTTCTPHAVSVGNTINFPAFDAEFRDPT